MKRLALVLLILATSLRAQTPIIQAPACTDNGTGGKTVSCTLITLADHSHYRLLFAAYSSGTLTPIDKPKQDALWFTGKIALTGSDLILTGTTNGTNNKDGVPFSLEFTYRAPMPGMPLKGSQDRDLVFRRGPNSFFGAAK